MVTCWLFIKGKAREDGMFEFENEEISYTKALKKSQIYFKHGRKF